MTISSVEGRFTYRVAKAKSLKNICDSLGKKQWEI